MDDYIARSDRGFLCFIIYFRTLFTVVLSYQVNPLRSLDLIIPEAAYGVPTSCNLEFQASYEVETYTRGTPGPKILINECTSFVKKTNWCKS